MNWYKKAQLTIEQIAQNVRDSNVDYYDDDSLKALCLPIARELRDELIKNGYNAMVVQGTFEIDEPNLEDYDTLELEDDDTLGLEDDGPDPGMYKPLHYWVEVNNLIVDITVSQFKDEVIYEEIPFIIIDSYSNWPRYTPLHRDWE